MNQFKDYEEFYDADEVDDFEVEANRTSDDLLLDPDIADAEEYRAEIAPDGCYAVALIRGGFYRVARIL